MITRIDMNEKTYTIRYSTMGRGSTKTNERDSLGNKIWATVEYERQWDNNANPTFIFNTDAQVWTDEEVFKLILETIKK